MAVRVRWDGRIMCAAMHPACEGDIYIDDGLHYHLSAELKLLVTEPWESHKVYGRWYWRGCVPKGVVIDHFYLS